MNACYQAFMDHDHYNIEQARAANNRFDREVNVFLKNWLLLGSPGNPDNEDTKKGIHEFAEAGALREYFKRHDNPLEMLLSNRTISAHLCRPHSKVYFDKETGEPLLSKFESRIYNFAAQRDNYNIPYRYIKQERHSPDGDHIKPGEHVEIKRSLDIGDYFAARRADQALIEVLHQQLRRDIHAKGLKVKLMDSPFMPQALEEVCCEAKRWAKKHPNLPRAFLVHQRYGEDDKHFGGAMLIFNAGSITPDRILFCDSVPLSKKYLAAHPDTPFKTGAEPKFTEQVIATFGDKAITAIQNVGDRSIQLWEDNLKPYESDVNCSFYIKSMLKGLLEIATKAPDHLLHSDATSLHNEIAIASPEYYDHGVLKARTEIREANLDQRWEAGRSIIKALAHHRHQPRDKDKSWAEEALSNRASSAFKLLHEDAYLISAAQGRAI